MKLILPNENPDLDGVASAYAYSEFLKKKDERAVGAVFGSIDEKTEELLEELDEDISDASYYIYSASEIILVSASSSENMARRIDLEKVTEVIDHEQLRTDDFPNADLDIEEDVGTAAAIIAQKFRDDEIEISPESAALLHAAIESATEDVEITEKDQEIAEWLEEQG